MTDASRVLIADDQVPFRRGIRMALEAAGFVIVAEAATAPDATKLAHAKDPDLCLLDIDLPGGAIAAAEAIATQLPGTTVVMLSGSADRRDLLAAIRAGASGFLVKTIDSQRLPVALRAVLAGEAAIPRVLVAPLLDELRAPGGRPPMLVSSERRGRLTPREWQVLDLLSDELSTHAIATRLGIADTTVRRHVSGILHKLDAPDRQAALGLLKRRSQARAPESM